MRDCAIHSNFRLYFSVVLIAISSGFFVPLAAQGLPVRLDSLRAMWYHPASGVSDSLLLEAGIKLQGVYSKRNYDSFLCINNEMIAYGKAHGNRRWIANGWRQKGKYYHFIGKTDSAFFAFRYALSQIGNADPALAVKLYGNIGLIYGITNRLDSAVYYLKFAIDMAKNHPGAEVPQGVYGNLAECYEIQGNYVEALEYHDKELKNNINGAAKYISCYNSGLIYKKLGLRKEASEQFLKGLEFSKEDKAPVNIVRSYAALMQVSANMQEAQRYLDTGLALADSLKLKNPALFLLEEAGKLFIDSMQLDQAAFYLKRCIELSNTIKEENNRMQSTLYLAKVYCLKGNYRESLRLCLEVQPYFEKNREGEYLVVLYDVLSKNYEALGQTERALYFLKKKDLEAEKSNDNTSLKEGISAFLKYKTEEEQQKLQLAKENAEALAEASQARERLSFWVFGLLSLFLAGIAGFYYFYFQQKKKSGAKLAVAYDALDGEKQKLERYNQKLRRFSGIVSHDILSNLDLILSTGNVLVGATPKPERLTQYYDITQRTSQQLKTYCIGLLEEARQTHEQSDTVPLHNPMTTLRGVLERFEPALKSKNFRVETHQLPSTTLPVALTEHLFQNLVSNAIRHAATAASPMLHIGTSTDAQGRPCWVVEDNGPGVPASQMAAIFQGNRTNGNGGGQEIGLSLLKQNLNEYGADIRVEERLGGGARFVIAFKDS